MIKSLFALSFLVLVLWPGTSLLGQSEAEASQDLHLGHWMGLDDGEVGFINMNKKGFAYFVVDGENMGGESFSVEGMEMYMRYQIDYAQSPQAIDFILYFKKGDIESGRLSGIFRFEGPDKLFICVNFDSPTRPSTFEAENTMEFSRVAEVDK